MKPQEELPKIAARYLGIEEMGGDNRGPLVEAFQKAVDGKAQGEPWCAAFVAYCIQETGVPHTLKLSEHVLTLWKSNPHAQRKEPAPGLVVCWQKQGTTLGHAGIVEDVDGFNFTTLEGNTSGGAGLDRNGDTVARKARSLGNTGSFQLLGFLDPWAIAKA